MKVLLGVLFLCGLYSTQSASVNIDKTSRCAGQQEGSLISVPGECSQFYICLRGEGFVNSCGARLHFDPESRTCIDESRSLCKQGQDEVALVRPNVEEISVKEDICFGKMTGAFIPSKTSCQEYYVCIGNEPMLKECKAGLHFNPDTRSCIDSNLSSCKIVTGVKNIPQQLQQGAAEEVKSPEIAPQQMPSQQVEPTDVAQPQVPKEVKPLEVKLEEVKLEGVISQAVNQQEVKPQEVKPEEIKPQEVPLQEMPSQQVAPQEVVPSSVKLQEVIPQEVQPEAAPQQVVPVSSTIFAATVCLGQPNGALFPVPGSCSKYFTCLQQRALEQSCGHRHFDYVTRNCIDAFASECVEGDLGVLFLSVETKNGNMLPMSEVVGDTNIGTNNPDANEAKPVKQFQFVELEPQVPVEQLNSSVGDTNIGANNDGIIIGNANLQLNNTGIVNNANLVSSSSNVLAGNSDLGESNSLNVNEIKPLKQLQFVELEPQTAAEQLNISVGDTNLGVNNNGLIIGNANLSIKNNGTVSNVNIITASQNVTAGNSNGGLSNTLVISGGKLMANNKVVPIKQSGLPVNKKEISQVDTMDIVVSNSGIAIDSNGVVTTSDNDTVVGNTNLGALNSGIIIGNANLDISNSGLLQDINLVSGSSNVLAGNSNLGANNAAVVDKSQKLKEHTEFVLAIVDESNPDACVGKASGSLWPKVGSCTEFLTCETGVPYVGECPRGLHFNAQTKSCDWPEFAGCV